MRRPGLGCGRRSRLRPFASAPSSPARQPSPRSARDVSGREGLCDYVRHCAPVTRMPRGEPIGICRPATRLTRTPSCGRGLGGRPAHLCFANTHLGLRVVASNPSAPTRFPSQISRLAAHGNFLTAALAQQPAAIPCARYVMSSAPFLPAEWKSASEVRAARYPLLPWPLETRVRRLMRCSARRTGAWVRAAGWSWPSRCPRRRARSPLRACEAAIQSSRRPKRVRSSFGESWGTISTALRTSGRVRDLRSSLAADRA